jgi:hypothetical protein
VKCGYQHITKKQTRSLALLKFCTLHQLLVGSQYLEAVVGNLDVFAYLEDALHLGGVNIRGKTVLLSTEAT